MRDVGEERAERDDELDAEVAGELDDLAREGPPAQVGLDAEEEHGVALRPGEVRVVEDVLGPVDAPGDPSSSATVRTVAWKS